MADGGTEARRTEFEASKERRRRITNRVGLAVLFAALAWAVVHVGYYTLFVRSEAITGKKVVRFAHWQLEGRTVEALNWAAREYEKLHPDVLVRQIEVPERGYEQWVKTQLIGRTAPDLIELRTWSWQNLINSYFVPVSPYIDTPNPYNKGTDLEDVDWRDTYVDNMQGGWIDQLKDFYGVPLSMFTIRIFANKQLLQEATGQASEPQTLTEFFGICRKVRAYAERTGRSIVPIAGSDYTANMFKNKYWRMGTWGLLDKLDTDYDGAVSEAERLAALFGGKIDLVTDPHICATHMLLYEIGQQFNPGFMSAKRDQSVFLFAQGNAAMIATGSWDAGSFKEQVAGDFDILVFDFPVAAADDPKYGPYVRHRVTEAGERTGFCLGLTKISRDPELAIDFLRFLTCRRINEELNRRFRWFPAIRGAEMDEFLRKFRPNMDGVYDVFKMEIGADTRYQNETRYSRFISTAPPADKPHDEFIDEHYRSFITGYARTFEKYAFTDFVKNHGDAYNAIVQGESGLARARVQAMLAGHGRDPQGKARRDMKALVYAQVKRAMDRAMSWRTYQQVKAAHEADAGAGT